MSSTSYANTPLEPSPPSTTRKTSPYSDSNKIERSPSAHSHLSVHPSRATRPLPFFHPTRAEFLRHSSGQPDTTAVSASRWSSRASRKNRYSPEQLHVHRQHEPSLEKPDPSASSLFLIEQRIRHQRTKLKVGLTYDVSFWVAVTFVLGSSAWVRRFVS